MRAQNLRAVSNRATVEREVLRSLVAAMPIVIFVSAIRAAAQTAIGLAALARAVLAALSRPLSIGKPVFDTAQWRSVVRTDPPPRHRTALSESASPADAAIRKSLLATLEQQPWWQADVSNVFVHDGVVIYQGLFNSQQERQAARVAAKAIAGVREIRDDRIRAREWQAMA